ncbi:hypothetical protein KHS38_19225 [Mucilaginibacter sp. Bleaf8]|uniref:hypothetical protein n=1 Tax=Mucilaginibacter sp. Bleaf8 TaxID=2834430 RepID=UPI001BCBFF37|nr:hypothetical protein [Mucilaginibacter sp. Bleaf8]MBS7566545.1 hypothetical protein [Mucilaginibacter sp. Bleaf8]
METVFAKLPNHLMSMGKRERDNPKINARKDMFMLLEDEREWIVQLLQEDIGQLLSITAMELYGDKNQAANLHLTMALTKLRALVFELKPYLLQHFDLHTAITELFKHRFNANPDCCSLKIQPQEMSSRMETAVFRLVQKALSHVASARLSCCEFHVSYVNQLVQLQCRFEVQPSDIYLMESNHHETALQNALQTLVYIFGGKLSCRSLSDNQMEFVILLDEEQLP